MRYFILLMVALIVGLVGTAFAQPLPVPSPDENAVGWIGVLYQVFTAKEWGLFAGVLTVGLVALLKKLPKFSWFKAKAWRGWLLNVGASIGTVLSAALFTKQPVTISLILTALTGAVAAAGALELGKDSKGLITK